MDSILNALSRALTLILHLNPELIGIIMLSLKVSGLALIIATFLGLPAGAALGLTKLPGRGLAVSTVNTFMGLPPVVVGLFVYLLLSRKGPLGFLGLLYSPT
ncbi:MAG TPA: tungstate transporter permease, partial [Nitrospirota bacterium]|nr:tungstate transporter permease [Nitrospirota bacterium]